MQELQDVSKLEAVGNKFDPAKMLSLRDLTRQMIHKIAASISPGMSEEDAVDLAKNMLADHGMLRGWHDVYVRFGSNTLKTFGAASEPGVVINENDIFFIDIGPVYEDLEGDGGDTFVFGADPEKQRIATDVKKIFHSVRKRWLSTRDNGVELYEYAKSEAERMGWELNMDLSGHRISDFPHASVYDGPLAEVEFHPSELLWVLEIHILNKDKTFGAFFEDMLLPDEYFQ
jgi:Xaa-Pro aminopeptidase